jgi:cytochrome P450
MVPDLLAGAYVQLPGQHYPGGTQVAVNGWVLHRNKTGFGEDAEIYRPERWLHPDSKEMHRHMYQVSRL